MSFAGICTEPLDQYDGYSNGNLFLLVVPDSVVGSLSTYYSKYSTLMDEPFSALDAQTRTIMQEELVTLWEKTRLSTLYVTHNIQEAVMLADRVVLLSRRPGKVSKILTIAIPRADREKTENTAQIAEFIRIIWEHISSDARAALMEVEANG